jgi:hypothetical protein
MNARRIPIAGAATSTTGRIAKRSARMAAKARKTSAGARPTRIRNTAEKTCDNADARVPTPTCSVNLWMLRFGCVGIEWFSQTISPIRRRSLIVAQRAIATAFT